MSQFPEEVRRQIEAQNFRCELRAFKRQWQRLVRRMEDLWSRAEPDERQEIQAIWAPHLAEWKRLLDEQAE